MNDNLDSLEREALIAHLQERLAEKERLLETVITEKNRAMFQATVNVADNRTRSEAAATASRWKWNNWVQRLFPLHYDRIATKVHGPPSDDPKVSFLERWNGRRVSNDILRADETLMHAIVCRSRAKRREQQRLRREKQRKNALHLP